MLRGVDLHVNAGEVVALLGSNGAGKSTLNNTVCGLFPAWSGRIVFDGAELTHAHYREVVRAGLIQVPEGRRVFPNLTVLENLELGAFTRGRERRAHNIDKAFAIFPRLKDRVAQLAGTLSGGEQQMLAIGRGLMAEPKLLILDEPSLGLSPLLVEELFALIARLNREGPVGAAGRAERGAVAGDRAPRLCAGERQPALCRPARRPAGQRRAAPRLPGPLNTARRFDEGASMSQPIYDLLIKNVRVVRPHGNVGAEGDIAIAAGKVARIAPGIDVALAKEVFDGRGRLAFPGVVDAHMHSGIYSPLAEDAVTESRAAAQGGVTSSLNYFRTGQYYLNKGGPYRKFFPEVLEAQQGPLPRGLRLPPGADGRDAHRRDPRADQQATAWPSSRSSCSTAGTGCTARRSQREFLMIGEDEQYDIAHFEFVMRGVQKAREQLPALAAQISLSLHCETAEIMTAYTKLVREGQAR